MKARFLFFLLFFLLASCAEEPAKDQLILTPTTYENLKGWRLDRQGEAHRAFERSCRVLINRPSTSSMGALGDMSPWQEACSAFISKPERNDNETRAFFEMWFKPYTVNKKANGLFTGYYEPTLRGAWKRGGIYQTPLWKRPKDLMSADLGDFRPNLKGTRIAGKIVGQRLKPYDDRSEITQGSLNDGRAEPLLWVDDPIDAFFLEIQGSGQVYMGDGSRVRVGYDAQNGHPYTAIGKVLADDGLMERPVTMAKIRAWLSDNPDKAQDIMFRNASFVFFRRLQGEGPEGAQGVVLAPERSLAVDPVFVPLGAPIWFEPEQDGTAPSPRLVVAQDTGGAIKGPVRGDFFWGSGKKAEERAGAMQSRGTYYILLPRALETHGSR